jgi:hypothetical protein
MQFGDFMSKTIDEFITEQNEKDTEGKITLSKAEILELQNRVKHYLNAYETENRLNASDVARILGYTPMHYSRFKSVGTFNKIASVFLFLSNFSKLKDMSLTEFMLYVENKPLKTPDEQLARGLHEWEIELLDFMNKIESTTRRFFTRRAVMDAQKSEGMKERLEIALALSTLITYLDTDDLKLLVSIVKDFSKRLKTNNQVRTDSPVTEDIKHMKKDIVKFMKDKLSE